MTLTVNLSMDLDGRLRRAAEADGVAEAQLMIGTLEHRFMDDRAEAVLEMLRAWREEGATADAGEIDDRRRTWEAFKAGMNEHHSSGRIVFP